MAAASTWSCCRYQIHQFRSETPTPTIFRHGSNPVLLIPISSSPKAPPSSTIVCGPRDKGRGPLQKGRTLSTEAILAVQSLKRYSGDELKLNHVVNTTIYRLSKPDLVAALAELQRQDQWSLALKVFEIVRGEIWYRTDYTLYADMVKMLGRTGRKSEIERLVVELLKEDFVSDTCGLTKLCRALIGAEMGSSVVELYGLMKNVCYEPDEQLFGVLTRGLRRLGLVDVADLIKKDFDVLEKQRFEAIFAEK